MKVVRMTPRAPTGPDRIPEKLPTESGQAGQAPTGPGQAGIDDRTGIGENGGKCSSGPSTSKAPSFAARERWATQDLLMPQA